MVSMPSLWLPVLLAAVLVFIASSLVHMLLRYHQRDTRSVPDEAGLMKALRGFAIAPGEYQMPRCESAGQMNTPEFQARMNEGPIAFLTVLTSSQVSMGRSLAQWFAYCLLIGVLCAYLATLVVPAGAAYPTVFRVVGAAAFLAYTTALWQQSIWFKRSWLTTLKYTIDGTIYALLTAGSFAALWPDA